MITALPTPPSRANSPADFAEKADALLGALPAFVSEANDLAADVSAKQATASSAAATATTKASEAIAAESSATAAKNAAEAASVLAMAAMDAFDDRYLGAKSVDPGVDNDGNALVVGALYWNTAINRMKCWSGATWAVEFADAADVSFQADIIGSVSRNAQSKLRELVSAKDVGDVDGVGTVLINIPADYSTLALAMSYLSSKTIAAGTLVEIRLAAGTHDYTGASVSLNHPQGSQIRIVGAGSGSTILTWTNSASGIDGLSVTNGNVLGHIDALHITRTAHAGTSISCGLLADSGSTIICGSDIKVTNHYYGIAARYGSYIRADSAEVDGAGDVGIWAYVGSTVDCSSATVTNTADPLQSLGFGIQAEYGSTVNCDLASASGSKIAGIAALSGSSVRAHSAVASTNTGSGFFARDGATIVCHGATASNNTRYGVEEYTNGTIYYTSITATGNTLGTRAPVAVFDNTTLGARVVATSGDLRVDVAGANNVYFNSAGGVQAQIAHAAGSVNYPKLSGTSGTNVVFEPAGAGSNVDLTLRGRGTGSVFLGSSQTNYIRINPAAAGASPAIYPEGGTDLDLILSGKGTGVVRFGTWTTNADVAVNGYITIKDAAGNTRKLATIA